MLAQSRLDDARNAYQQAQALAPDLPLVYVELGQVYLRLGLLPKAEAAFRQALTRNTVSPEAHTGLGICLQLQGQTALAVAEHQQALQLDPTLVSAHVNLAAVYTEQGQLAKAEATLKLAGAEQAENGLRYARLAVISLYQQHLLEAQTYAQRAVSLLPKSAIAHFVLGQVYQEQDRLLQAGQEFRLATTLDPRYAPARYALGVVRGTLESGMSLFHPLGAIDAANQGGPGQQLNIQNMQTPGAADRIQAALEDPTVVRVASRAFGDLQLDGQVGEDATRDVALSYLHESEDRRGVLGVNAGEHDTDGVRANADQTNQQFGVSLGRKAVDSPSGWFALGQLARNIQGNDMGIVSTSDNAASRQQTEIPYYLLGGNLQSGDTHRTLALVAYERPFQDLNDTDPTSLGFGSIDTHTSGRHAELRHDIKWSDHLLSVGISAGDRIFDADTNWINPLFPLQSNIHQEASWEQVYLHDAWRLSEQLIVIGEVRAERVVKVETDTTLVSPFPFPTPPVTSRLDTYVGLPSLTLSWQATARDGLHLRARGVSGGIDDFQLLLPTEVFLFPTNDLPTLILGGRGQSYEAEFDHTFADASLLRLGFLQQKLTRTVVDDNLVDLSDVTYQAIETRYERAITPTLSGFLACSFISTAGRFEQNGVPATPLEAISDIPNFKSEIGLQYLDPRGWYVQPTYGYQGSRFAIPDAGFPDKPRSLQGGFGVFNLRVGKRWGLRTSLFAEVDNLFDQHFTVFSGYAAQLQPGRLLRVRLSQRF